MYSVIVKPSAEKSLVRLPQQVQAAIIEKLLTLEENPRPAGVKKLQGREGWRVRVGDYRVVYVIDDAKKNCDSAMLRRRRSM